MVVLKFNNYEFVLQNKEPSFEAVSYIETAFPEKTVKIVDNDGNNNFRLSSNVKYKIRDEKS